MPISDESRANNKVDYKQKYKNLKRKLKLLIYENECYSAELRKSERQLLQVSRDKSFLLDRLLQYENIESSTSDSDDTLSSDTDNDQRKNEHNSKKKKVPETPPEPQQAATNSAKKKKTTNQSNTSRVSKTASSGKPSKPVSLPSASNSLVAHNHNPMAPLIKIESTSTSTSTTVMTAACSQSSVASSNSSVPSTPDGHMTAEELERHLESRRQPLAMLMPEKTPLTVPVELFSNESSGLPDDDNNLNLKLLQH